MKARLFAAVLLSFLFTGMLFAADWRPVTEVELAQKTPRIDPAADAEAIFWDIKIEDSFHGGDLQLTMNHYIRIKIFTDRGRDKYSTIEIEQFGKRRILDVAGRTIKANGAIVELKKDAIFDRDLVKTKGFKAKGKSFTMPNVEVGDIIEYRYKEVRDNEIAWAMRLYYQRDLPMWNVTYHLKPLNIPYLPFGMRGLAIHCNLPPFQKEPDGYVSSSMINMPAFQEESYMPPEDQLRAWVLIYYEEDKKIEAEKYWKQIGREDYQRFKPQMNADNLVKRTAAEIVSGVEKPEDKLTAIETFCRTKIRNLSSASTHLTAEERKALKESHSPGDTLKQKAGWGIDINLLFSALANAAGFDARMARLADRGDTFFSRALPTTYFLHTYSVAVKVNDQWTFRDPSTNFLEPGMLRWQEEAGTALISDPKEGFFVATQYSEPSRSMRRRRGTFKLSADGSLDGVVQYTYTGHEAHSQKSRYEEMTAVQQEEEWKKSLQNRFNTAEISEFEMKDNLDAFKPMMVKHKVTVPGYATRTGKRILLQPAFFERNYSPRFTETNRKWDIYFDYGWAEDDEVTIDLPEGWELDQPVAPVSTRLADVGNYSVEVRKTVDGRTLIYKRRFEWGFDKKVLLPVKAYPVVKQIFEFVQQQDDYTIALKAAGDAK
jgi:Domain of Unknown Function with PDB structure (DUF3857)/Transglutaminase-like superfamily